MQFEVTKINSWTDLYHIYLHYVLVHINTPFSYKSLSLNIFTTVLFLTKTLYKLIDLLTILQFFQRNQHATIHLGKKVCVNIVYTQCYVFLSRQSPANVCVSLPLQPHCNK